ncbi:MAG TPA: hypothetical protein VK176_05200 [Phycisphaerales bacterium]|nr:hypothetical protein [Phycisphaerales bacterium]
MQQPETPDTELQCLRCDSQMERGFYLDRTHGGAHQLMWCPGDPTHSFWTGGVKSHHATTGMYVVTYRCTRCGRLESFGFPPPHRDSPTA